MLDRSLLVSGWNAGPALTAACLRVSMGRTSFEQSVWLQRAGQHIACCGVCPYVVDLCQSCACFTGKSTVSEGLHKCSEPTLENNDLKRRMKGFTLTGRLLGDNRW